MQSHTMFIAELILFDGLAVVWGAWEFWSARPDKKGKAEPPTALASRLPEDARHPEGQHRAHGG